MDLWFYYKIISFRMCHFLSMTTHIHTPYKPYYMEKRMKMILIKKDTQREIVNNQQHFPLLYVCCLSLSSAVLLFYSMYTHVGTKCVWCIGLWIFLSFLMPLALLSLLNSRCLCSFFLLLPSSHSHRDSHIMNGFLCTKAKYQAVMYVRACVCS